MWKTAAGNSFVLADIYLSKWQVFNQLLNSVESSSSMCVFNISNCLIVVTTDEDDHHADTYNCLWQAYCGGGGGGGLLVFG